MKLLRPLLVHQKAALQATEAWDDAYFHMAMRTGKTLTVIRRMRARGRKRVLVVAPLTVLIPWSQELRREGLRYKFLDFAEIGWEDLQEESYYLIGPSRLLNESGLIRNAHWDAVVVDESTMIKNPKASITKLLNDDDLEADERICLSGWGCPEGDEDWFEQQRFVHHGYFMGCDNFWQWRYRHFRKVGYDWVPKPGHREIIKQAVLERTFFLTAAQAGMPDKFVEESRYIELSDAQRKIYNDVEREFAAAHEGKELMTKWKPVQVLRLHQISSGEVAWDDGSKTLFDAKLKELHYLLNNELRNERSIVVYFRFLAGVREVGRVLGSSACRIDGSCSRAERDRALADFQQKRKRVILVQADCGRYALDLSVSSVGVFYSLGHSLETFVQCRQRHKHPFKKESNLLIYLTARHTMEEDVLPALADKRLTGAYYQNRILHSVLNRHVPGV